MKGKASQLKTDASINFLRGKEYVHPNGEVVRFDDQDWCIKTTKGKRVTVNFRGLPGWLLRPSKLTLADGWLVRGMSPSWVAGGASIFRRIAAWLENFAGDSITELPPELVLQLQLRLDRELTRYRDTLEEIANQLGKSLTDREQRRICIGSDLLGPTTIRTFVRMFNAAAFISEEIDGFAVPVRLRLPRALRQAELGRPIGSADANKVLSPEQIAELEWALNRDLRRYDKAIALLNKYLGNLDVRSVKEELLTPVFDIERYFGINGFREHTAAEITSLRGLSPHTYTNVPRRILRFLSPKLGVDLATEIIHLRSRYKSLLAKNKTVEVRASREYIREVLSKIDLSVPDLKAICVEAYFGLHGRQRQSLVAISQNLDLMGVTVRNYIQTRLTTLVGGRTARRLLAIRKRLRHYLTRAIKAQALRLQLAAARRVGAIVDLPLEPRMKVGRVAGRRVVEIQFIAVKTWGDEGLLEWVPCIDRFGDIAQDAIRTAQRLTRDLRAVATNEAESRLFIIPDKNSDSAVQLTCKVLEEYLYSNQPGKADLLRRYGLEGLFNFEIHHVRHTRATNMIEAGGTIQDVARYLGHVTFGGSASMAGVFYLAGGTEAMRHRTAEALRKGAATGFLFDGIARLKIAAMGTSASEAAVPPNQLSFQEARKRILSADILDDVPVGPEEAVELLDQRVVFNVTRYGGCLLQANSGPCPTANPCPIGILPKDIEPSSGCGCKYLVLTADSVEQLTKDIKVMESQLTTMKGQKWVGWRGHIEAKIAHFRTVVETAQFLNG